MSKEHILSASRIKTYESCSWKYWCGYVLKLPKSKNDGNVRGSACHLVLEVLLNKRHKKYIKKIIKSETIKSVPSIERLVSKSIKKRRRPIPHRRKLTNVRRYDSRWFKY